MFILSNCKLGFCAKASDPWIWTDVPSQAQRFATHDEALEARNGKSNLDIQVFFQMEEGVPAIGFENRWNTLCNMHQIPHGTKEAIESFIRLCLPETRMIR